MSTLYLCSLGSYIAVAQFQVMYLPKLRKARLFRFVVHTMNFELSSHLRTVLSLVNVHKVNYCLFLYGIVNSILF